MNATTFQPSPLLGHSSHIRPSHSLTLLPHVTNQHDGLSSCQPSSLVEVTTGRKENKNLSNLGAVLAPGHLSKRLKERSSDFWHLSSFFKENNHTLKKKSFKRYKNIWKLIFSFYNFTTQTSLITIVLLRFETFLTESVSFHRNTP